MELVIPYRCNGWSVTLREIQGLRVFENRMLRKTFGPEREEVAGQWCRLHNTDFHDLYPSPNITGGDQIKKNEMGRACGTYGIQKSAYRVLVGRSERKG
jgi:hypothetical protein